MTVEDAFALLGLPTSATKAQVMKRFRLLARRHHPDAQHDELQPVDMALLNEAHAVAMKHVRDRTLVPTRGKPSAVKRPVERHLGFSDHDLRRQRAERSRELERRIVEVKSHQANKLRRRAGYAGVVSGLVASLGILLGRITEMLPVTVTDTIAIISVIVGVVAVIAHALFSAAAGDIEGYVAELSSYFDNRGRLLGTIQGIASGVTRDGEKQEEWTYWELRNAVEEWAFHQEIHYEEEVAEKNWSRPVRRKQRGSFLRTIWHRIQNFAYGVRLRIRRSFRRLVSPEETPLFALAYRVGESNFIELLIAKGMELDLLIERQIHGETYDRIVYALKRGQT